MTFLTLLLLFLLAGATAMRPDETIAFQESLELRLPVHGSRVEKFAQDLADFLESEVKLPQATTDALAVHTIQTVSDRSSMRMLNHYTFAGNVLPAENFQDRVHHWLVSFCIGSHQGCQQFSSPFEKLGSEWEAKLNTALLNQQVRFATVDCATNKELCNEQHVTSYPTVYHYQNGKRAASWIGGRLNDPGGFMEWLEPELREVRATPDLPVQALGCYLLPGDRAVDLLLVLGVLFLNCLVISSGLQPYGTRLANAPLPRESSSRVKL